MYVVGNNHTINGKGHRGLKGSATAVTAFKKQVLHSALSDCIASASQRGDVTGIVVMGDWNLTPEALNEAVQVWPKTRFRRVSPTCHKLRW